MNISEKTAIYHSKIESLLSIARTKIIILERMILALYTKNRK
jgi:hypothetical protein